jgi:hypothetical protein
MNNKMLEYAYLTGIRSIEEEKIFDGFISLIENHPKKIELMEKFVDGIKSTIDEQKILRYVNAK